MARKKVAHGAAELPRKVGRSLISMSLSQRREAREVGEQKGISIRLLR